MSKTYSPDKWQIIKLTSKGKDVYKDIKMSLECKAELEKAGEPIPQELVYNQGCKLGKHLEFSSGNAVAQAGITENVACDMVDSGTDDEVGLYVVFDYAGAFVFEADKTAEESELESAKDDLGEE